jgi:hypothetical protein
MGFAGGVLIATLVAATVWPEGKAKGSPESTQAASTNVGADAVKGASKSQQQQDLINICKNMGEYARTVMEGRQNGVPMSKLIDLAASSDDSTGPTMRQIIIEAYDHPRMSVEANKATAAVDFENKVYLECIKVMLKK